MTKKAFENPKCQRSKSALKNNNEVSFQSKSGFGVAWNREFITAVTPDIAGARLILLVCAKNVFLAKLSDSFEDLLFHNDLFLKWIKIS